MTGTPPAPRILGTVAGVTLLAVAGYAAAGLAGGAIPRNPRWHQPPRGVRIFVESNGVHVALVLPKHAAGVDWARRAAPRDLADPRYAAYAHVALSWGEHDFFLKTPTWADATPATIAAAAIGSDRTLIHVEHVPPPDPRDANVRSILLRPAEYARLAAAIEASFADRPRAYRGYAGNDVFYTARGRYSAVRTCNAWTGAMLAAAGVRIGWWTPFAVTVTAWFAADQRASPAR